MAEAALCATATSAPSHPPTAEALRSCSCSALAEAQSALLSWPGRGPPLLLQCQPQRLAELRVGLWPLRQRVSPQLIQRLAQLGLKVLQGGYALCAHHHVIIVNEHSASSTNLRALWEPHIDRPQVSVDQAMPRQPGHCSSNGSPEGCVTMTEVICMCIPAATPEHLHSHSSRAIEQAGWQQRDWGRVKVCCCCSLPLLLTPARASQSSVGLVHPAEGTLREGARTDHLHKDTVSAGAAAGAAAGAGAAAAAG